MAGGGRIRCFVIGGDSLLMECGEILRTRGHEILGVISSAPRIAQWAKERGLVHICAKSDYVAALKALPFDHLFAITHLSIIPDEALTLPRKGAINFHDGPLPRYAGLNAPVWALMNRESEYAITFHVMTPAIDAGEILKQKSFSISEDETALSLNTKCFEAGIETFGELVDELARDAATRTPQDLSKRSYISKHQRPKAACVLDWNHSAEELCATVRALDFGRYENPVGSAKIFRGQSTGNNPPWPPLVRGAEAPTLIVTAATAQGATEASGPGTVVDVGDQAIRVATGHGLLCMTGFASLDGRELSVKDAAALLHLRAGQKLGVLTADEAGKLTALNERLCKGESFFAERLARLEPVELPCATGLACAASSGSTETIEVRIPPAFAATHEARGLPAALVTAFGTYLLRVGDKDRFHLDYTSSEMAAARRGFERWTADAAPLEIAFDANENFAAALKAVHKELESLHRRGGFLREVAARYPALHGRKDVAFGPLLPVGVAVIDDAGEDSAPTGAMLTLVISAQGRQCEFRVDCQRVPRAAAIALSERFSTLLESIAAQTGAPLSKLELLPKAESKRLLTEWNDTASDYPKSACIHHLFEEQVRRRPGDIALTFEDRSLTYRELNERANRLAAHLRELGVGPDKLVGVHLERSLELLVATMAVLKAGGAYVPLDPAFPEDRIAFMIEDARIGVLVTDSSHEKNLRNHAAKVVRIDADAARIADRSSADVRGDVTSANLSYVLYTSGSTGKPKGVMVEHRNVANFFTGMDERLSHDPPGVWLAVTTLSFDISVLELFWTLSRGFKVVIFRDRDREGAPSSTVSIPGSSKSKKAVDFSLYYWGNDAGPGRRKYEMLLEGAKFADANGFSAVWTPERHFHAFGGPYPNPSVVGAAVAAITSKVGIRAGSCVVPLHHPIRVAEEWGVVDNLSNGRVGISFASGWQPHDFVLRPENYKDNKAKMLRDIEIVRRLWRGESVSFPGPDGEMVPRTSLPRPVQRELPFWVTTAGNPETYRQAGAIGANVLTHLLGQSVEEVAKKIVIYREALKENGFDPASRTVTLMLHTFVGKSDDEVRELVRGPMKDYLRSAADLIKQFAWAFPAFKRPGGDANKPPEIDLQSLTPEELDEILDFAFLRYFETSGLFGSVETCVKMIDRVREIGVDEIGCLVDFGLPTETVLAGLPALNDVRVQSNVVAEVPPVAHSNAAGDYSFAAEVARHKVTHLQCTPSMARMLLLDDESRAALKHVGHLMIGGEAFPPSLAKDLRAATSATITNMYGPTETTIWSSTHRLDGAVDSIPIGRPIANTQLYVLSRHGSPSPIGTPGELFIAGDGVARGYLFREELTGQRFVPDPFRGGSARMYKTGDLARYRADGNVEFIGRNDHQVKIRGYRIELGEIEALLNERTDIRESAALVREDTPGDQRLVGYLVAEGTAPDAKVLREYLGARLPSYMVPAAFVTLPKFPLTPNGKVDRKALPAPESGSPRSETAYVAPENDLETTIVQLWQETLAVEHVGVEDNFFDIGGHSLLVVKMHRRLKTLIDKPVSLTDLYRFPTIRSFTRFLGSDGTSVMMQAGADRGAKRREMLARRRG